MTANEIATARRISEVFVALGGDPPKRGHARAFWRDGDNPYALSLNDSKACWYDHRDDVGGGVLHLVQHVRGGDKRTALRWLADFAGLPLKDQPLTLEQRRKYRQCCSEAEGLAQDVADWERGLELFLVHQQEVAAVITEWLLRQDGDPGELLMNAKRNLTILRETGADSLVQTYRALPESVRNRFTEQGSRDREHAEIVTSAIVEMLTENRLEGAANERFGSS